MIHDAKAFVLIMFSVEKLIIRLSTSTGQMCLCRECWSDVVQSEMLCDEANAFFGGSLLHQT